jgi:hypothetical protein
MDGFPQAVADIQTVMRDYEDMAYALSSERQREAEQVAPCAARWVKGEMDPTRRLAVARGASVGPLGAPPSLAEKLGTKLEGRGDDDRTAAAYAVHKALAVGYLAYCETEERADISIRGGRRPEDIWEYWVTSCRTQLEAIGIPASWAKTVGGVGADVLVGELRTLKLTRYLGGSKLNQLGLLYSQAGVHLRIAQVDSLSDAAFADAVRVRREWPDRPWRYEDYSPS